MAGQRYFFTGHIYELVDNVVFSRSIEVYLQRMRVPPKDLINYMKKFIYTAYQSTQINCPLSPSFHIMAFRNGVVDMEKLKLYPFSPDFHVIFEHDYCYDPDAVCPIWDAFLRMVLPEKESMRILQMYLGLGLYNRGKMADKVENCLFLYGSGSNEGLELLS